MSHEAQEMARLRRGYNRVPGRHGQTSCPRLPQCHVGAAMSMLEYFASAEHAMVQGVRVRWPCHPCGAAPAATAQEKRRHA